MGGGESLEGVSADEAEALHQLYEYLKNATEGQVRSLVTTADLGSLKEVPFIRKSA